MRARKAVSRKAWFWARSPKLPPSMRVMVSMTRWDGAREAKAGVTCTTSGRTTGSSVMNGLPAAGGVGPGVVGDRPGHRLGVQLGGAGSQLDGGREQVAAPVVVGPEALMRRLAVAAELDPAGVADGLAAHADPGPGAGGGDPDVAGQPAAHLGQRTSGRGGHRLGRRPARLDHGLEQRAAGLAHLDQVAAQGLHADHGHLGRRGHYGCFPAAQAAPVQLLAKRSEVMTYWPTAQLVDGLAVTPARAARLAGVVDPDGVK